MGRPLQLLVQGSRESTRIALLDETRLLEFYQEDTGTESLVGSVFLGRVERVLPDVKAAFVKLGLAQNGFLPLREAESYHRACGNAPLLTGQDVLVQVKKDPKGEKGAFLTRDIGLPGQYVLLMPKNRFVGLSRRVTDENDRTARGRWASASRMDVSGSSFVTPHSLRLLSRWRPKQRPCGKDGAKLSSMRNT